MTKRMFAVTCSLLALVWSGNAYAGTLSDSMLAAVSSHPQMQVGEAMLNQASKSVREQKSDFYPNLALSAETGRKHLNDSTTRSLTADNAGAGSWVGKGTVTVTQPIFSGFSTVNKVKSAKYRYDASEFELDGMRNDIALRAASAHLNVLRSSELVKLVDRLIKDIEARRQKISLMVEGGAASEAELFQADELIRNMRNTRIGFEKELADAEASYAEVVGTVPTGTVELGEKIWDPVVPLSADDAVTKALAENPRVQSANRAALALQRDVKAEKASLMPNVNAAFDYSKEDQSDLVGGETTEVKGMVRMGWNFSVGGKQLAAIDRKKQEHIAAAARRNSLKRSIERDVRQKFSSMRMMDKRLALATERRNLNDKVYKNFKKQFEAGKQTNLQLLSARIRLFESGSERINAYYGGVLTRLDLIKTMGLLDSLMVNDG